MEAYTKHEFMVDDNNLIYYCFLNSKEELMIPVLVNSENADLFLQALDKKSIEDDDIIVGVVDEDEEIACGVLWAVAIEDEGLLIKDIYILKEKVKTDAGRELISFFLEIAGDVRARTISYSYIRDNDNFYMYELLDEFGFIDESYLLHEYLVRVRDLEIDYLPSFKTLEDVYCLDEYSYGRASQVPADTEKRRVNALSFISIDSGKITGILLIRRFKNMLEIESLKLFNEESGKNYKTLYSLIKTAVQKAREILPDDTYILLNALKKSERQLLSMITNGRYILYDDCILQRLLIIEP